MMRTSRAINFRKLTASPDKAADAKHRGGKLSVPMYSAFFSSVTDVVMCTNTMYGSLQRDQNHPPAGTDLSYGV